MSQRNVNNERTRAQLTGTATGYTRKSASRAKPARESASGVHVVEVKGGKKSYESMTKEERKAERREQRAESDRLAAASNILMSHDDTYRRRRRVWWLLLGLGLACTALAWIFFAVFQGVTGTPGLIALIGAYVFIIGGFVYDWLRVRPIRKQTDEMVSHYTDRRIQDILDEDYEEREAAKREKGLKRGRGRGDASTIARTGPALSEGKRPKRSKRNSVTKL